MVDEENYENWMRAIGIWGELTEMPNRKYHWQLTFHQLRKLELHRLKFVLLI